jgi:hypothetical protein
MKNKLAVSVILISLIMAGCMSSNPLVVESKEDPINPKTLGALFLPVYQILLSYKKLDNNLYANSLGSEHKKTYLSYLKDKGISGLQVITENRDEFNRSNKLIIQYLSILDDFSYIEEPWRNGWWGETRVTVMYKNQVLSPKYIVVANKSGVFKVDSFNF